MAPEATPAAPAAAPAAPAKQGGNVFTRKIGPMPMWAWVAIISVILIGYAYYRNKQSAAAAATTATGTDASQVPQFVNQTYTSVTPPVAGPAGPAGPTGPAGPGGTVNPGGPNIGPGNKIPGHHVVTATGRESLATIARRYHTSAADILKFTEQHKTHVSPTEAKFFRSGGKGKIPRGLVLWVPEPQVTP
jgi:hypothetical protein